jgi:hypothetical protein
MSAITTKKSFALVAGLAVLLTGCPQPIAKKVEPCTTQDYSPAEIFQNTAPSIVVIKSGDSLGSGFVVKQDKRYTYILTNSHVVNRADEVLIKWSDDREEKGKVISDHGGEPLQKDLALVRVDAIRGEPLLLKEQPPAIGEDVVVIGAPQGLEFSLSRGVMSQLRNKGDFLQVDAAVNPGNSGGPLFDKTGCVVGVVTFKSKKSEGLNFAIGYLPTQHFLDNPGIERPKKVAIYRPAEAPKKTKKPTHPQQTGQGWITFLTYHRYDDPDKGVDVQYNSNDVWHLNDLVTVKTRSVYKNSKSRVLPKVFNVMVNCRAKKITEIHNSGIKWQMVNGKWMQEPSIYNVIDGMAQWVVKSELAKLDSYYNIACGKTSPKLIVLSPTKKDTLPKLRLPSLPPIQKGESKGLQWPDLPDFSQLPQ